MTDLLYYGSDQSTTLSGGALIPKFCFMHVDFNQSTVYDSATLRSHAESLIDYIQQLQTVSESAAYQAPEASINLPSDEALLMDVQSVVEQKVTASLRYIFVVGIGGSNLGTKAVYDALYGYQDFVEHTRPKIIFVDTNNAAQLQFYIDSIITTLHSPEEYLVFTISKSGGTTETLANTEILLAALTTHVGDPAARTIVITDEGSAFAAAAESAGIAYLAMPPVVGGRYSVLSAVGVAPLLALGLDVVALRAGAVAMRTECLQTDVTNNPAALGAAFLAHGLADGKTIHDTFVFSSQLESLGKWYRQLLGESIGKAQNNAGEVVHTGITPTVSVGSTDLHSVGQLYLGGPKDKTTSFVSVSHEVDVDVPTERVFPIVVSMIDGKSTADIMQAILGGVKIAYNAQDLPFMDIQFDGITPYELGAYMQYKMIETMCLGHLLQVNPFDQPNVEMYKTATKQLLES